MTSSVDAHVWTIHHRQPDRAWWDHLSAAERDKAAGFLLDRDHDSYVMAHALTRLALSWCRPAVPPMSWIFVVEAHGRPEISRPAGTGMRFNLSHAPGAAACLVAETDCGVDIETFRRPIDVPRMSRRWMTPPEQRTFAATAPGRRTEQFVRHWTAKEAYVKARGLGMRLPFDRVGVECGPAGRPALRVDPSLADDGLNWHLEQRDIGDSHIATVALRGHTRRHRVTWHHDMPTPAPTSEG